MTFVSRNPLCAVLNCAAEGEAPGALATCRDRPSRKLNRGPLRSRWFADTPRDCARMARGQTVAEYAIVLVAIAVVVLAAYAVMGSEIGSTVGVVNTTLVSANH